jgi:transposase
MARMSEIPVESLNEMTPAVRTCVQTLCARIQEQDRIIASQQKQIENLERRLVRYSGNSSMPPWSDGPGQQPVKPTKDKSGNKRGGQHGHAKRIRRIRPLVPTEDCDRVEAHRPSVCSDCGPKLNGDDPNPVRHEVTEIPAVRPIVTEYQIHTLECPECGCRCRGQMPQQIWSERGGNSHSAQQFWKTQSEDDRHSAEDLLDLEISDGGISRLQSIGPKAMQAGCDQIAADIRNSAAVNINETGWREDGRKAWLWTVVGRLGTLFAVRTSRSRAIATDLLGEKFKGIVVSDRYSAYSHLEDRCAMNRRLQKPAGVCETSASVCSCLCIMKVLRPRITQRSRRCGRQSSFENSASVRKRKLAARIRL